jgi:DNA-binding beta-propeller fold protein YncE
MSGVPIPTFQWIEGWGSLPAGMATADIPAVGVDSRDRVYVFARAEVPIVVLDQSGDFLGAFGQGVFKRPHGIAVGPDDTLWCVDDEGHQVVHMSADGAVLEVIARPDQSATTGYRPGYPHTVTASSPPFCYPTGASLSTVDELWVTDGYGNARVHCFGSSRTLLESWGDPGSGLGEFVIPHGVLYEAADRLLVTDRENERIQVLDRAGRVLSIWGGLNCPNNVVRYSEETYAVTELGRAIQGTGSRLAISSNAIPARVTIRAREGSLLAEFAPPTRTGDERVWFAPHGVAVDSHGALYVGEVLKAYSQGHAPATLPTLHKLVRTNEGFSTPTRRAATDWVGDGR